MLDEEKLKKPDWWPKIPYPEKIFPMKDEEYEKIVPDPRTRTALSGCLGRGFYDSSSKGIWDAFCGAVRDGEVVLPARIEAAIKNLKPILEGRWLTPENIVDLCRYFLTGEKDQKTWRDEDFGLEEENGQDSVKET